MDLNEILAFTRVVQAGSFTGAARHLGLPKSTVSRRVAHLEETLGARLLQRTTRKLRLTDVGAAYYQHCERIIAETEAAAGVVTRMQAAPRGTLRVTAPVDFGVAFLGPVAKEFLDRYRQVRLDLTLTDRMVDVIQEGFDVAIRAGSVGDSSLVARKLGQAERWLCASPGYVKKQGQPRSVEDLAKHSCLLFRSTRQPAAWELQSGRRSVQVDVSGRLVANHYELLREAALNGLGVALLPAFTCARDLAAERLVRILPDWCSTEVELRAMYPSVRYLAPGVRAFVDLLAAKLAPPRL